MTLTQLSYIIAVDRYRHFATAAEKSYVTQPTLSMQIHKLEEELGVVIFDRTKSPVVPTERGREIIDQAQEMLRISRHIEDIASLSDEHLRGTFRVGIIPTIAPYLLPVFLNKFADRYPDVNLVFEELVTSELLELLERDQLDAGIIATPPEGGNIFVEALYYEPFVGYVSKKHPLADHEKLSVDDLETGNLWLLNEGHCFRDQAVKLCKKTRRKNAGKHQIEFASGNLETLKQLVEQNFGMTLLPYLAINQIDRQCAHAFIKEFERPVPRRKVRLVYGREYLKTNIIKAFGAEIKSAIPEELKEYEDGLILE